MKQTTDERTDDRPMSATIKSLALVGPAVTQ